LWVIGLLSLAAVGCLCVVGLCLGTSLFGVYASFGSVSIPDPAQISTLTGTALPGSRPSPTHTFTPSPTLTITDTSTPVASPTASPTPVFLNRPADAMLMVYVPAGNFSMGSPASLGFHSETPQHTVSLDAFWIDQTDISNARYAACVKAGACQPPKTSPTDDYSIRYYRDYPNYPVTYVNWSQADAYCGWVGAQLPSEAQWEKAARGTDGRLYPWGNADPSCALTKYSPCMQYYVNTSAVDEHPGGVSPYGALDMAGNVKQWVADWYGDYSPALQTNPTGPSAGTLRVVRGGSFISAANDLRSAYRLPMDPASTTYDTGFRCVRE
jgi:formylglycine-generating enzyme required for sulfatase activity